MKWAKTTSFEGGLSYLAMIMNLALNGTLKKSVKPMFATAPRHRCEALYKDERNSTSHPCNVLCTIRKKSVLRPFVLSEDFFVGLKHATASVRHLSPG